MSDTYDKKAQTSSICKMQDKCYYFLVCYLWRNLINTLDVLFLQLLHHHGMKEQRFLVQSFTQELIYKLSETFTTHLGGTFAKPFIFVSFILNSLTYSNWSFLNNYPLFAVNPECSKCVFDRQDSASCSTTYQFFETFKKCW